MANQTKKVLEHLKTCGTISPAEALSKYRIMRLASRIADLKAAGYDIGGRMVSGKNADGETVRYKEYWLNDKTDLVYRPR